MCSSDLPADLFEGYRSVDAADVCAGAEGLQLDYSYLLAPSAGSDGGDRK